MVSRVLTPIGTTGRKSRRPSHPFQLKHRPWQIQPFLLAPVLPGETLKNLLMQSRVVSDPLKHPLIGWWVEYYFFYVKHRDLAGRDDFTQMMLNINKDLSAYNLGADAPEFYAKAGQISWMKLCLERVVETYFRDEDETGTFNIGNLPAMRMNVKNWTDSLINAADYTAPEDVAITVGVDDEITAGEIDDAMRQYQWLRQNQLTDMSYEDFLGTYGVRPRPEEFHRPELLRYVRNWTYPTNHVDPSNGAPSSAVSWAVAERADKDRFFREPGFVFGVTVARPKVYFGRQTSTLTGVMRDALSWLPAILADDPYTSLRMHTAGSQPIGGSTDDYVYDLKDLFLYGEQFVNFALGTAGDGSVALPSADIQSRYPSGTDADALFASASPANTVRQDGVTDLQILGALVDTTPQGIQG